MRTLKSAGVREKMQYSVDVGARLPGGLARGGRGHEEGESSSGDGDGGLGDGEGQGILMLRPRSWR